MDGAAATLAHVLSAVFLCTWFYSMPKGCSFNIASCCSTVLHCTVLQLPGSRERLASLTVQRTVRREKDEGKERLREKDKEKGEITEGPGDFREIEEEWC